MALEKFRAAPLPNPPIQYDQQYLRQIIRVLEVYFNQLDSLTPNQAQSYRADRFIGGDFSGDDTTFDSVTTQTLAAVIAAIQTAQVGQLSAEYASILALLSNRIVATDIMAPNFYGEQFYGYGNKLILPHIAASDSTDQIAGGNNTPTVVNWNTLDSGFGWTLNSPGSATAQYAGVYTIRYSLQFANTANAIHYADVWLKVNNNDVANSTSRFTLPARKSATDFTYNLGYSEVTFIVDAGDEIELYWATDQAGNPTTPTDGVYIFHDAASASPYNRPAIPSAIGSISFVSALNKINVAPLPAIGFGQVGTVEVTTNLG